MRTDLAEFLANYRAERAKDIADTPIYIVKGWNLSHHNRIVFFCPVCAAKIGADVDTSEGPQAEIGHECEACGAEIRLVLEWRIEPQLIGIQTFAVDVR